MENKSNNNLLDYKIFHTLNRAFRDTIAINMLIGNSQKPSKAHTFALWFNDIVLGLPQ